MARRYSPQLSAFALVFQSAHGIYVYSKLPLSICTFSSSIANVRPKTYVYSILFCIFSGFVTILLSASSHIRPIRVRFHFIYGILIDDKHKLLTLFVLICNSLANISSEVAQRWSVNWIFNDRYMSMMMASRHYSAVEFQGPKYY